MLDGKLLFTRCELPLENSVLDNLLYQGQFFNATWRSILLKAVFASI